MTDFEKLDSLLLIIITTADMCGGSTAKEAMHRASGVVQAGVILGIIPHEWEDNLYWAIFSSSLARGK